MQVKSKVMIAAAVMTLIGGLSAAGALTAGATTLTCTNIATATASPFGCGGLQSAGTAHGTLDLAHTSNVYNSLVTVQPDASVTSEDWTAFQVDGLKGAGDLGIYVAMDTPDGLLPDFTTVTSPAGCAHVSGDTYTDAEPCAGETFTAGPDDLCISVEQASHVPGTNGKDRWWTVLRSCNTNGEFTYGTSTTSGSVTGGFANQWQAWAPVESSSGYVLVNTWLFNHDDVNYVLDITANGGAGTATQAYPENDQVNEEFSLIGCTLPASHLGGVSSPPYVNCP